MPEITVIVPVYKVEKYLRRCIDSILNQTFTDFELILVDDGSPDNCPAICDEYAEKDRRIHVIHQANGGLSAARNTGIDWAFANSSSKYLAFIDSDDWVHPRYLEYLYRGVAGGQVPMSICEVNYISSDDIIHKNFEYANEVLDFRKFYSEGESCVAQCACGKLYLKELFAQIRYPHGRLHEDVYVTYNTLFQSKKVSWIPLPLYYYYRGRPGITMTFSSKKTDDCIQGYLSQYKFFRSNKEYEMSRQTIKYLFLFLSDQIVNMKICGTDKCLLNESRRKLKFYLLVFWRQCGLPANEYVRFWEIASPGFDFIYSKYRAIKNKLR